MSSSSDRSSRSLKPSLKACSGTDSPDSTLPLEAKIRHRSHDIGRRFQGNQVTEAPTFRLVKAAYSVYLSACLIDSAMSVPICTSAYVDQTSVRRLHGNRLISEFNQGRQNRGENHLDSDINNIQIDAFPPHSTARTQAIDHIAQDHSHEEGDELVDLLERRREVGHVRRQVSHPLRDKVVAEHQPVQPQHRTTKSKIQGSGGTLGFIGSCPTPWPPALFYFPCAS